MKKLKTKTPYVWTYYPNNKQGYLKLKEGVVSGTVQLVKGKVLLDKDGVGNILGIEILL